MKGAADIDIALGCSCFHVHESCSPLEDQPMLAFPVDIWHLHSTSPCPFHHFSAAWLSQDLTVQYIGLRNCMICSGHLCIAACKLVYMLVSWIVKRQRGLNPTSLLQTFCIASLFPIRPGALLNFPSCPSNI